MKRLGALHKSVLSCCFLILLSSPALSDSKQEAQLEALKRSIASLQKELRSKGEKKNVLLKELRNVEVVAGKISSNIRTLETDISGLNKKLDGLDSEKKLLVQRIRQQSAAVVEQITAAYKLGKQEPIKLLLNQEDPERISRIFKYYDYFLTARTAKIDSYTADVDQLSNVIHNINEQKLALANSRDQLKQQQTALSKQKLERSSTLKKLNAALRSDRDKLNKFEKERGELEALLRTVEEAIADLSLPEDYRPFSQQKGKLNWPLKGRVHNSFGSHRTGSLRWEGWLISARSGTPVRAVHHGRVVFSDYLRGFGLLVIVDHGDNYMSLYGHNQELLKETGDWVLSNETLARAGNSGGLDSPALYFEIRKKGKPADPKVWLARR